MTAIQLSKKESKSVIFLASYRYNSDFWWSNPEWWQVLVAALGVFSSLLLAYIAIFGRESFIKLNFSYSVSKINQKINGEEMQVFRIKLKNRSKRAAKNVLVSVTAIKDKKNSKFDTREDFIHMPLEWTHTPMSKKARNIAAQEEVYFDIGQYDLLNPGLKLYTNPRTDAEQLFAIMNNAKITIRVVEEHGFTEKVILDFKIHESGGGLEIISRKILNRG